MKPFITPEMTPTGKKAFRYQCEGVDYCALGHLFNGRQLMAYAFPEGHTLQAAWALSFVFDEELVLEFSPACTQAVDWQEVGSLNIRATNRSTTGGTRTVKQNEITVPAIALVASEKLIYEDEDVVVECGLVLRGRDDQEVVIAAGVPPGSVSVRASFSAGQSFEPQFPLSTCRRELM